MKPGSYLEVGTTRISEQPYWSLRLQPAEHPVDEGALAHNFLDLFDEAVRVRLHGDYPIGAYLSGGIDFVEKAVLPGKVIPNSFVASEALSRMRGTRGLSRTALTSDANTTELPEQ